MTGIPENISREVPPDGGGKPRTVLFSGAGSEAGRPGRAGGGAGGRGREAVFQDAGRDEVFFECSVQFNSSRL